MKQENNILNKFEIKQNLKKFYIDIKNTTDKEKISLKLTELLKYVYSNPYLKDYYEKQIEKSGFYDNSNESRFLSQEEYNAIKYCTCEIKENYPIESFNNELMFNNIDELILEIIQEMIDYIANANENDIELVKKNNEDKPKNKKIKLEYFSESNTFKLNGNNLIDLTPAEIHTLKEILKPFNEQGEISEKIVCTINKKAKKIIGKDKPLIPRKRKKKPYQLADYINYG